MNSKTSWLAVAILFGAPVAACDQGVSAPADTAGARLAIDVAPLTLSGITNADYTLTVTNGAQGGGDTVWTRTIDSDSYGDGAGALSYVGTCDASTGTNSVTLTLNALYEGSGVLIAPGTWVNPTPITQDVPCAENSDTPVTFNMTVLRDAQQGFFDVAVNFDDIFCSAKFDCCYDTAGDGCGANEDITLLFDGTGQRARTFILGFACTAGPETGVITELYLDPLTLDCSAPNDSANFATDLRLSPAAQDNGNLCAAGQVDTCSAVIDSGGVGANNYLYQLAAYRGHEALPSGGGDANMVYWNVALGVSTDIANCRLRATATADDAADTEDGVVDGVISTGRVYPMIQWDLDLGATCGSEALAASVDGPVSVTYTASNAAATQFVYRSEAPACAGGSQTFNYTGADQQFTMPADCGTLRAKVWGAGGGSGLPSANYDSAFTTGGSGGFTTADFDVAPGTNLTVMVGQGGYQVGGPNTTRTYGGGGGTGATFGGAMGGGRSALRMACGDVITAGGGGGGSNSVQLAPGVGGAGGGWVGGDSYDAQGPDPTQDAQGGTQSAGGAPSSYNGATAGAHYLGGHGSIVTSPSSGHPTSGGGGGWYGGGGGNIGAGGGGSGYADGCGAMVPTSASTTMGGAVDPAGNADPDYVAGRGVGGAPNGGHGLVVLTWSE